MKAFLFALRLNELLGAGLLLKRSSLSISNLAKTIAMRSDI
jgi:hypothetical protein